MKIGFKTFRWQYQGVILTMVTLSRLGCSVWAMMRSTAWLMTHVLAVQPQTMVCGWPIQNVPNSYRSNIKVLVLRSVSTFLDVNLTTLFFCGDNFDVREHVHSLGALHTRDWEPLSMALPTLSLVEKAEPVQVCFTQRLRDQRSMWIQDGCKVYMDSHMAANKSCFMVTWTISKNHLFWGRPNIEPGDHGTPDAHNRCFVMFYHAWGPVWIEI